ncbi:MAG: LPS export ABC transporter periplasmic protein LptC [bacterium]
MKFFLRAFLLFLLAGFGWLLHVVVNGTGETVGGPEPVVVHQDEDIGVQGVRFSEWKRGKRVWMLDAKEMRYYHTKGRADFDQVSVSFRVSSGQGLGMEADSVHYDTATGNLTAEGRVVGRDDQGYEFFTDTLSYDAESRTVATRDQVTLKKDRLTIKGVGMQGDLERNRLEIRSGVRAHFLPPNGG